ncbi:type I-F CRISPR-associated endoribonuclease Cas6/Csy4 [Thermithiobacillus tepidarius DSM 3134]|uniref:type I-F CRISPR-associated endoribonuclease Cas6/Csy4 n=1 Tax=Thermithiobacillus tepidarius TaxID=929 RepID=UPI0009DC1E69|nr:type I-F CRISPR-associated endoribonuclease Cas6/Csy4 [Thermithiobacillus tepidarius]
MRPSHYFNVEVRGSRGIGFGSACVLGMTRLIGFLHPFFKTVPDTYAIDLPAMRSRREQRHLGHVVRVFASSRDAADTLASHLESNPRIADLAMLGRTRTIDVETFDGPWVTLRRFRVASRSQPNNRMRDLDAAQVLPFVRTRSHTNDHAYTLTLLRKGWSEQPVFGTPNSYGLSGETPVCLPDLPA